MNFDAIPDEMKQRAQWVGWKLIPNKDGTKPRKMPVQTNGKPANSTDKKTWASFEKVLAAYQTKGLTGVGYVQTPDDPYSIIDLDDAVADDGKLKPHALEIVNRFDSYTEISQSGHGLHIIIKGKLSNGKAFKHKGIEVYDRARYFALTGNRVDSWTGTIEERPSELNSWVSELRTAKENQRPVPLQPARDVIHGNGVSVIDRARAYLKNVPEAISEKGGHNRTFGAAIKLVFGFALTIDEARPILQEWNARCVPPWSERELEHKLADAAKITGPESRGYLRDTKSPNALQYKLAVTDADSDGQIEQPYRIIKPLELLNYDTSKDPNALFKNRWLCRGGSVLFVGQSGLGKSSLAMMTVLWSLGESLFGIQPVKPLKIDVVQAENDDGDLAEMFQGVIRGMELSDRTSEIQTQVSFIPETARTGAAFITHIEKIVAERTPDLLIIDPLLAYLGGDVNKQDVCSAFLRNGLNVIGQKYSTAFMLIHHTPKPFRGTPPGGKVKASDLSYLGAGSAELTNWARAVLTLRELDDGVFEFRAAKRGKRAGLTDAEGFPTDHVFIEHSKQGICWVRASINSGSEAVEKEAFEAYISDVLTGMKTGTHFSATEVRQLVEKETGKKKSQIYQAGTLWNRIYHKLLELTKNPHFPGKYTNPNSGIPVNSDSFRSEQENTPNSGVPVSP